MTYEAIATRLPGVGSKRVCVSCATRFYDLARTPPVCPKCGTAQPPEAPRAAPIRRVPGMRHRMLKAPIPVARDVEDDAAPVLDVDEDEADEDAEVIEEDTDEEDIVIDDPTEH